MQEWNHRKILGTALIATIIAITLFARINTAHAGEFTYSQIYGCQWTTKDKSDRYPTHEEFQQCRELPPGPPLNILADMNFTKATQGQKKK